MRGHQCFDLERWLNNRYKEIQTPHPPSACAQPSATAVDDRQARVCLLVAMAGYIEDSQGKAKFDVNRRRSTALTFVAGLCLGVLASCVYVKQRGGGASLSAVQQELVLQQSAVAVRRLDAGSAGASSSSSSSSATSAAHKELEAVLQRIAPDREVGCMHGSCSQSPGQVVVRVYLSQRTVQWHSHALSVTHSTTQPTRSCTAIHTTAWVLREQRSCITASIPHVHAAPWHRVSLHLLAVHTLHSHSSHPYLDPTCCQTKIFPKPMGALGAPMHSSASPQHPAPLPHPLIHL